MTLLLHHHGGWRPSPHDPRDKIADPGTGLLRATLSEVDPRSNMPGVFDQGQLGSCTANAVAAALEYDAHLDGLGYRSHRPSRLDIYYGERALEGELGAGDTGAYGRDGFKFAQQTGYLYESAWPYDITTYAGPPPAGTRHKLTKPYAAVTRSVATFKAILSNQQTIAFGFVVYESFESDAVASSGVMPMPAAGERRLGGHEVLMIGYLASEPGYALCRNSWGSSWGEGGYFLMPWTYLTTSTLSSDFRTIVRPTT